MKRFVLPLALSALASCAVPAGPEPHPIAEPQPPQQRAAAEVDELGNKDVFADLRAKVEKTRKLLAEDIAVFSASAPAPARRADDAGAECTGIAAFSFGETRNRLGALAMQHYGLKQDERLPLMRPTKVLPAKCGFSFRTVYHEPTEFTVDRYPMGSRAFQLMLLLDSQAKFYRVEFCETGAWRRGEYDTRTVDREKYIAELFTKRFGPATGGKLPPVNAVKTGRNVARYWNVPGAKAGTEVALGSDGMFQVRGFIERTK